MHSQVISFAAMLLGSTVSAANDIKGASLQGSPQALTVIDTKFRPVSGSAQNVPDGKMWMMPKNPSSLTDGFLINATPNNFLNSTSSSINDVYSYPGQQADQLNQIPNTIPIPSPEVTGLRGNGTNYDEGSWWIFNAYRLSETSQPGADPNKLIGFEHNEDYYQGTNPTLACTSKSIGVRYSDDLGHTWTRSVPILTKGIQNQTCGPDNAFTGTGDFTTVWNPQKKEWVTYAQEGVLVMSHSTDALARPGTWERINPVTGQTTSGFIGPGPTLAQGDLAAISGASPTIIFDSKHGLWQLIYNAWGGGLVYSNSRDLYRWQAPQIIAPSTGNPPNPVYATLVGDGGDTLTTDGTATILCGANNTVSWGRALWSIGIEFSGATVSSLNRTAPYVTSSSSTPASSGQTSGHGSSSSSNTLKYTKHRKCKARKDGEICHRRKKSSKHDS